MAQHFFTSSHFIKSCPTIMDAPELKLKEVLFVGKSNVGKSSLINALTNNLKLAFTSSKPGHTRLLNYYLIENYFYFVDCPGYGFSTKKGLDYKFYGDMIEGYFENNENLKLIVFLLDSRHLPTKDDLDFYNFLKSYNYNYVFAMTKCDKLNQSEKARIYKNISEVFGEIDKKKCYPVSIKNTKLLQLLKDQIELNVKE
ncbi:MAG TPA: ribosome biogenesis GTP-binding protein YihA/YsxC [Candidatus Onthovivens sp.]|nr:ribosome biogenesis GTP-binding protein YihA/YsxC [Candidatus Onthovivens sp.]